MKYFESYENYFWQWEDQAEVISIPKGNTIAYKAYIKELLAKLAPQGLPPFGSLLLALVASNPNSNDSMEDISYFIEQKLGIGFPNTLDYAYEFLHTLSKIPEAYKKGDLRIQVLQSIFQDCHNILSIKESSQIAYSISNDNLSSSFLQSKKPFVQAVFSRDFRPLSLLQRKYPNPESIIKGIASLPEIKEEMVLPEIEVEEGEPRDLISELSEHAKTFPIGALIKRIWSGIHLPVQSSSPSQQALGGVSDITNKGNFDQLLISEYAHDDLVFLQRLANNEALYIQREVPPSINTSQRVFLIDVSLKNWGTPKTVAFATMLAIANHPKSNSDCVAFAVGNTWNPISIENIEGIIEGLQFLEGSLHFAKGLDRFFTEYPISSDAEIILITEPSTLQYPDLQQVLSKYHRAINYWIHTDAHGHIDVYRKQQKSKRHLQHIALPLEELWQRRTKVKVEKEPLVTDTYPLLFRNSNSIKWRILTADGALYEINKERSLFRFYSNTYKKYEKGWLLIHKKLPFIAATAEIGSLENGEHVLLMFDQKRKEIHLWNLHTSDKKKISFPQWKSSPYQPFVFDQGAFYYKLRSIFWRIDIDGQISEDRLMDTESIQEREKLLGNQKNTNFGTLSLLKNVREVFINEKGNLVFNKHQLMLTNNFHLKLEITSLLEWKVQAEKNGETDFQFSDGSSVEINRSGMFMLHSSNPNIPTIYIPSALDSSLGVAVDTHFSGNEYYFKNDLDTKQEQVQDITDRLGTFELEKTEMEKFYNTFIQAYIDQILSYEN